MADTTNEHANRVRVGNRIQQFQLQGSVSPIAEMLDVAGEPNLLASIKKQSLNSIKENIDAAIGSAQVPAAGSSLLEISSVEFFMLEIQPQLMGFGILLIRENTDQYLEADGTKPVVQMVHLLKLVSVEYLKISTSHQV